MREELSLKYEKHEKKEYSAKRHSIAVPGVTEAIGTHVG